MENAVSVLLCVCSSSGLYSGFGFKAMHLGGSGALLAALIPLLNCQLAHQPPPMGMECLLAFICLQM